MHPSDLTPPGCCECGCGMHTRGRFIKGHGGHSGARPPIEVVSSGCWIWRGKTDVVGYGRLRRDGRDWLAHRWVYERLVGGLDSRLVLDHLCRTPSCVNPSHLEQVTDAVNVRRGAGTRLTAEQVAEARKVFATGDLSQRATAELLGKRWGLSPHTIRYALRGESWATPKYRRAPAVGLDDGPTLQQVADSIGVELRLPGPGDVVGLDADVVTQLYWPRPPDWVEERPLDELLALLKLRESA